MRQALLALCGIAVLLATSSAQDKAKRPSPPAQAQCKFSDGKTVTVDYSSPRMKGRKIYGDWPVEVKGEDTLDNQNARPAGAPVVPWGHVWRAGANEATVFQATDDVLINDQPLAAGRYLLAALPGKDGEWTIRHIRTVATTRRASE